LLIVPYQYDCFAIVTARNQAMSERKATDTAGM